MQILQQALGGCKFLAAEQAVQKLLTWVVKGTSACYVPVGLS